MNTDQTIELGDPAEVSLPDLRAVYLGWGTVEVDPGVWRRVRASVDAVSGMLETGEAVYGINTGFGLLARTRIAEDQLVELQHNLVLSHSAGVGDDLTPGVTRLVILLKVVSLAQGYSGVRPAVIEALLTFLSIDALPCIPAKGSVGASGDLAPLSHLAAALLGVGRMRLGEDIVSAEEGLARIGLKPLTLGPKEGLALLNGTQVSTALALAGLFDAENLFASAVVAGSLSVDGLRGSTVPFDDRIHRLRRQPGQRMVAAVYRRLLEGSEIRASHDNCDMVQDPYSLRCQPQVMGACLDLMRHAARTLHTEANAVTDNPLVFPDTQEALSGGNFHAEPVAFAADTLALAIAEIGSLSERRTALLVDPSMNNGLPAFLVEEGGVNSGFMIAQITAAALVSENKGLAHPASVDSIPTSANQEDHVSMAAYAGRRLQEMNANAAAIVAVELLAACQAIDFHSPKSTSGALREVHVDIRKLVEFYAKDRYFKPDIDRASELVLAGSHYRYAEEVLPSGRSEHG